MTTNIVQVAGIPTIDGNFGGENYVSHFAGVDLPSWHRGSMGVTLGSTRFDSVPGGVGILWRIGYYYPPANILPNDGDFTKVCTFGWLTGGPVFHSGSVRLVNVSGTHKWGLFDDDFDSQFGTYSSAQSLGAALQVCYRQDTASEEFNLFVGGASVVSHTGEPSDAATGNLGGGGAGFWSGWQRWVGDDVGDLDEGHFPEGPFLQHPNGAGNYTDYTFDYTRLDDLVALGVNDGDGTFQAANDGTNKRQTWTLTNPPTFDNPIVGMLGGIRLRQDFDFKSAVHGSLWRLSGTDKVISRGSENLGLIFRTHWYYLRIRPGGGSWSQADVGDIEFGHRRDAGDTAFNYRLTAAVAMSYGFGATNKIPALPDLSLLPPRRRHYPVLHRG